MHTCILFDTADLLRPVFPLLDLLPGLVDWGLCQSILQRQEQLDVTHEPLQQYTYTPPSLAGRLSGASGLGKRPEGTSTHIRRCKQQCLGAAHEAVTHSDEPVLGLEFLC